MRRHWFEWELQLVHQLDAFLDSFTILDRKRIWRWMPKQFGNYSVFSAYNSLLNWRTHNRHYSLMEALWKVNIPPKASHAIWRFFLDRVPSRANLVRRNIAISDPSCIFCNFSVETTYHCLLACPLIQSSWMKWFDLLHCPIASLGSIAQLFLLMLDMLRTKRDLANWRIIIWAILWCVWRCRNNCCFNGLQMDVYKLWEDILITSWMWLKGTKKFSYPLSQWLMNLMQCIFTCMSQRSMGTRNNYAA